MSRHPSDTVLAEFLEGHDDAAIESHVETCVRCSDALEAIADPPGALPAALDEVLTGDQQMPERVLVRVAKSLSARETAEAFFSLFGVGVETAQVVLSEGDVE